MSPDPVSAAAEAPTDEQVLLGACAIERELRRWGWEPPTESMLKLCAARCIESVLRGRAGGEEN